MILDWHDGWGDPYSSAEYLSGRSAFYRATDAGNTYPLLGIADHAYWYSRWVYVMGDRLMKCSECGQEIVQPPLKAGDIVEYSDGSLGVIASEYVTKHLHNDSKTVICTIGLETGAYQPRHAKDLRLVHGHFHVETPLEAHDRQMRRDCGEY